MAQENKNDFQEKREKELNESYAYCRAIAKQDSNFYLGMLLTRANKRNAMFAIYAWLHAVDEITDKVNDSQQEKIEKLQKFSQTTFAILSQKDDVFFHHAPDEKYWLAFRKTVLDYQIPYDYLKDMIEGQKQDLVKKDYATFTELYDYCHLVAGIVGLMCIHIWGHSVDDAKAKCLAEWNGIAFQLTNILRDLMEDMRFKRVYLPAEFVGVDRFTYANFEQLPRENLMQGITKLIAKTDEYYNKSQELFKYIHPDGRLSYLMLKGYYQGLFKKIRANPELVLTGKKIRLNKLQKSIIIFVAMGKYLISY